jgi:hypothetical protein
MPMERARQLSAREVCDAETGTAGLYEVIEYATTGLSRDFGHARRQCGR